jgi:hypothetical protein
LLAIQDNPSSLSPIERRLIERFRELCPAAQAALANLVEILARSTDASQPAADNPD